jgi:hypothetical protein
VLAWTSTFIETTVVPVVGEQQGCPDCKDTVDHDQLRPGEAALTTAETYGVDGEGNAQQGVHRLESLTLETLTHTARTPQRDRLAVPPDQVVGGVGVMRDKTSRPSDDLVWRERRRKPPKADPREPSLAHHVNSSAAGEYGDWDFLDPVVPLVASPAAELNDSAIAHVDPVVVVEAAADAKMIPGLERGEIDLSHQVIKPGTPDGELSGTYCQFRRCRDLAALAA